MSSENLSPRQKMINLMYLVLIALLALNVSKEVIQSFVTINDSIENSNDISQIKNLAIFSDLKMAYNADSTKAGKFYQNAEVIIESSNVLIADFEKIKKELIKETDGLEVHEADTIQLVNVKFTDAFDVTTSLMIGDSEDGSAGYSKVLREKIENYMSSVNDGLENIGIDAVEAGIDFGPQMSEAGLMNWEMNNFYRTPLAAGVTILSKLENDINRFEYVALSKLLGQIDSKDIPIDTVAAQVIANSNYVLLGDKYSANIVLSAYSTTQEPILEIGRYDANGVFTPESVVETVDGQGKLALNTGSQGIQKYEGRITIIDKEGDPNYYPFASEYLVAKPAAVISPTKMNVFYRGLKNPLDISVPGIPAENIRVSISGGNSLQRQGNGKYIAEISSGSPSEVEVKVSAEVNGNVRKMGVMKFRTKYLPKPRATVKDKSGSIKMRKPELRTISGVKTSYGKDFVFDIPINTRSYKMTYFGRNGNTVTHEHRGSSLNSNMKEVFSAARTGDRIEFHDIKAEGKDGIPHKMDAIMITVR